MQSKIFFYDFSFSWFLIFRFSLRSKIGRRPSCFVDFCRASFRFFLPCDHRSSEIFGCGKLEETNEKFNFQFPREKRKKKKRKRKKEKKERKRKERKKKERKRKKKKKERKRRERKKKKRKKKKRSPKKRKRMARR